MDIHTDLLSLSPVEAYMLLHPYVTDNKLLLKYCLLGLLYKQYYKLEEVRVDNKPDKHNKQNATHSVTHFAPGPSYKKLDLKSYEQPLYFEFSKEVPSVLLSDFTQEVVKRGEADKLAERLILPILRAEGFLYIKHNEFLFIKYDTDEYTSKGKALKELLQKMLEDGKNHLNEWSKSNPSLAANYLKALGPSVVLLDKLNPKLAQTLNAEFGKLQPQGGTGWDLYNDFYWLNLITVQDTWYYTSPNSGWDWSSAVSDWGGSTSTWDSASSVSSSGNNASSSGWDTVGDVIDVIGAISGSGGSDW